MFKKIQDSVDQMVAMFKRSKFSLAVATQMDYDEGFVFTENNIVAYLAELEEYINTLIVYMAFKRDDPNAAIAAIPFESLNTKDFKKKDTTLENPPEHTFGLTLMQAQDANSGEVVPQDEAEIFIKKRQLYANFQRLWHMRFDRDTGLPTYDAPNEGQR